MSTVPDGAQSGSIPSQTRRATDPLLEVEDMHVEFHTQDSVAHVLNGVNYYVDPGETLAVLGESGSGKSVTAQAIMGILSTPPARITGGSVRLHGEDLLTVDTERKKQIQGEKIALIFQDALSALNPVFTVGFQVEEQLRIRRGLSRSEARKQAVELLDLVQIPNAKQRIRDFPHQFSGGMRQRVMIAMSLALDPEVLIADEPTTALDVTVQAQIMDLLSQIQRERDMAMILITHDLGVVAEVADRISVMYAGRIVETGDAYSLYHSPGHPYTEALLRSIPRLDRKGGELYSISGLPPTLTNIPPGCPFHPRCSWAVDICRTQFPESVSLGNGQSSACHRAEEMKHG